MNQWPAGTPPPRSDDPPEGNVWTLKNGERLETPELFFDWMECYYRDNVEGEEPGSLDRLIESRRVIGLKVFLRLRQSHN